MSRTRAFLLGLPLALCGLLLAAPALAQGFDLASLLPEGEGSTTGRIVQLVALLTVLSIAPGLMIMVTSFVRFVVALSFLRSGMGLQSTPANLVLISLALFMTFYVMAPTFDRAWAEGIQPLIAEEISEEEAFARTVQPFREFMLTHVREEDLAMFQELASASFVSEAVAQEGGAREGGAPAAPTAAADDEIDLRTLIPAFMISELRRGFEIGFIIALPFLVIDIMVATIVMSMGMMMMPPTVISLPFKILFFVLIDGWNILVGGLVRSYF
ncbi:EscR/YscR/HrcR family type III secretion system export apparatus protein [Salinarimonas ramus]|uniref:Flagellar biosynthetic protein FliP n=1 Tax=Salinarimonas ramus TaxID=690164 RepID=A0A917QBQ9_9HYPH|nr:EscR/YscR/HrcR family type III secretion system export apparatus protein [Salinarimonas ramus]GGK41734.1 flagellar biosynthetic protein FliP [Salinarimonas ramus]